MITSKSILNLLESFFIGGISNYSSREVHIYLNPDLSDIIDMTKTARDEQRSLTLVRVVVDAKKKLIYAADAYGVDHSDIRNSVKLNLKVPWVVDAIANIKNGKLISNNVFVPDDKVKDVKQFNWKFVDKYIKNFSDDLLISCR